MADIYSKDKRRIIMRSVKVRDTQPEVVIRKILFREGFRFRKNVKVLPGKPDIVLVKDRVTIFVNGCFWHGHKNCKAAKLPTSNAVFWREKIESNTERDRRNKRNLKGLGWKVITVWQCEMTSMAKREKLMAKLVSSLKRDVSNG